MTRRMVAVVIRFGFLMRLRVAVERPRVVVGMPLVEVGRLLI